MTLADRLEFLMELHGLTAKELSHLAGINMTGVSDITSGRSKSPQLKTLKKIADALQMTVGRLLGEGAEDKVGAIAILAGRLTPEQQQEVLRSIRLKIHANLATQQDSDDVLH